MRIGSLRVGLGLLMLAAVAPPLVLVVSSYQEERRAQSAQVQMSALRLARLVSADHERLIEVGHQLLVGLARLPEVRRRETAVCSAFFADLAAQYPYYNDFAAHDPDGRTFCSALHPAAPEEIARSAWFLRALQSRAFTTGQFEGEPEGRPALILAYPVTDDTDRVQAVLTATLDLAVLNRVAARAGLPLGSTVTLIDTEGRVLARYPDPAAWLGRRFPDAPVVEAIRRRPEGTIEAVGIDGVVRMYGFTALAGPEPSRSLYVSVGLHRAMAYADLDRTLRLNVLILIGVGLLALLAAWVSASVFIVGPVNALVAATGRLAQGDLRARVLLPGGEGELGRLGQAFDTMADALEVRQAEADQARRALQESARQLQVLSRRLVEVQEAERRQLARELHDEIGQALTGLKLLLEVIALQAPDDVTARARTAQVVVDDLLARARDLSLDLRPAMLDDLGLTPALLWYFDRYTAHTGIEVDFAAHGLERRFRSEIETAAYRIVQEALTNVARHAQADRVTVTLSVDAREIAIEIQDRGTGFDVEAALAGGRSAGIAGMRERVALLGGRFDLEADPGGGTRLAARLPIAAEGRKAGS